jgi:hypothetical protein
VFGLLSPGEGTGLSRAYYVDCDDVRSAGAAPLNAHAPGYRAGLDRDGDGVACEPLRL